MLDELFIDLVSFAILEVELKRCSCGYNRYLYQREDVLELEAMCCQFEKEDGVMNHVQEVEWSDSLCVQTEPVISAEGIHQNHVHRLSPTRSAIIDYRPEQIPLPYNVSIYYFISILFFW